jgi:hypothetical protein
MLASYTWGKLITDDFTPPISFVWTQGVTYQDRKNMNLERSISAQDLTHQFSFQSSYDLPAIVFSEVGPLIWSLT